MTINYKHIPDDIKEKYAYVIEDLTFDMQKLQDFYETIKEYTVDYSSIRGSAVTGLFSSIKVDDIEGKDYLDYPVIQKLVSSFNPISKQIGNGNISIVVYQPGFNFHPHIDFSRKACIMYPIYPSDGGVPVDYYDMKLVEGLSKEDKAEHDDEHYLGSFYYSTKHPTLMNAVEVHGVRNHSDVRVYLQFSLYDDYDLCVERIKSGEFLNV